MIQLRADYSWKPHFSSDRRAGLLKLKSGNEQGERSGDEINAAQCGSGRQKPKGCLEATRFGRAAFLPVGAAAFSESNSYPQKRHAEMRV
jgi:hypothetical protein